jgi:hypothetical protein
MKLLVIIAEIVKDIEDVKDSEDNVTLLWLVRRIRKLINNEIAQAPSSIIVVSNTFNNSQIKQPLWATKPIYFYGNNKGYNRNTYDKNIYKSLIK